MQHISPPMIEARQIGLLGVSDADVVALPVSADADRLSVGPGAEELSDLVDIDWFRLLDHAGAAGKAGEIVEFPVLDASSLQAVLLVGIGPGGSADFRRAGAALARRVKGRASVATSVPSLADESGLAAFVEGLVLGSFGFARRKTEPKDRPAERVILAEAAAARDAVVARALVTARAGWSSREMALTPGNEKSPQWLAEQAEAAASRGGLQLRVWDEKALSGEGFGGILAVGQGSPRPPRLIRLDYNPAGNGQPSRHVVLVGKGITFDTGGLSLKPVEAMMNMKRDMTGGGVVIATMAALRDLDVDVRVTGLVAAAENSISGSAQRPGDVITHYGGRTSEVTNTDAEGRLVLADALA